MDSHDREQRFRTPSDIGIRAVYEPEDAGPDPSAGLGEPGAFPFTRGVYPDMYRGRPWTMRQYAGFGTAVETNHRFRFLLEQGQTGLSVAFDLPTQMGIDSDDPLAAGEVGRVGVAIDTLDDMELLFDQIPLERVSTSMTINATAAVLLAMYVAVADRRGIRREAAERHHPERHSQGVHRPGNVHLSGRAEPASRDRHFRLTAARELPRWNSISISGYHMREAGSTADPGDRVHARECPRVRSAGTGARAGPGAVRAASEFLLRGSQRPVRGGREVQGGPSAVGAFDPGGIRGVGSKRPAPVSYTDRWIDAHGPAAAEQRDSCGDSGDVRRAGWDTVAAHKRV